MFGIGLGEILLILFIIFIISPREIPRVMTKIGELARTLERFKNEFADAGKTTPKARIKSAKTPKQPAQKKRRRKTPPVRIS